MHKNEKELRKQLKAQFKEKEMNDFKASLPMNEATFKELFDFLDEQLQDKDCGDTMIMTKTFLENRNIKNIDSVISWLSRKGGYCDCEVLANVEEHFQ